MDASSISSAPFDDSRPSERPRLADGISLLLLADPDETITRAAIKTARDVLASVTQKYEILVIPPDGSTGASSVISYAASNEHVRDLTSFTDAKVAAWQQGVRAAQFPWAALAPADNRYRLSEFGRLLPFATDFDGVCGYRTGPERSWGSILLNRSGALLAHILLRTGARDPGCPFKVFRRDMLADLPDLADDSFAPVELLGRLQLADAQMVEAGVTYTPAATPAAAAVAAPQSAFQKSKQFLARHVGRPLGWLNRLASFWWSESLFAVRQPAATMADSEWQGKKAWRAWGVLIAAALVFFFMDLSFPLLEPDESRYARIAQHMITTGDYLVPQRFGEPYLDKPPLLYWLTAASYQVFGVSDGAARVVCAMAGLITVLATYGIGRYLVGQRAAWLGAFSLMLCSGFALGGKFLIMDGLLTCWVTLAMLSGYLAIHGPRVRTGWCIAASLFVGLGVMTKGPLAVVLFLPPLIASRWLTGAGPRLAWKHWALCLSPGILLALPWFVLVTLNEPQFLEYFFWRHHVERFTTDFSHDQPWWYYIPVLMIGMFPASLLLPPLGVLLLKNAERFRLQRTREMGYLLLVAGWIFFFFSLSRGKLPPYIIPMLPPLCLLCGKLLDLLIAKQPGVQLFPRTRAMLPEFVCQTALAAIAIVGIIDLVLGGGRNYGFVIDGLMIAGGGALYFYLPRSHYKPLLHQWATAGALAWIAMAYSFLNFYPDIAYSRSIATQAQELCDEYGDATMPVILFGRREESVIFYLPKHRVHEFGGKNPQPLVEFLRRHPRALLVSDRDDIALLRKNTSPGNLQIEEVGGRGHLFLSVTPAPAVASGAATSPR